MTTATEPKRYRFHLVQAGELKPRPMNWLIQDLFECETLMLLFGDPGSAKTFMSLDMALCIATGIDYHGRPTKQGPVVFIAGEGQNGLARRLAAWSIRYGKDLADAPLYLSKMAAAVTDKEIMDEVSGAIAELETPPALIVLDTLARNFGPGDENSTQDMTAFVRGCDELRLLYGCTVGIVHHSGHGDKSRSRGSTVLNAAMDSAFQLTRDNDLISIKSTKQKDAPTPEPFAFQFRTVELGIHNDDGSEATSAVLHPTDAPIDSFKGTSRNQDTALRILDELTDHHRENLTTIGKSPDNARVSLNEWRTGCVENKMPRRSWYDVRNALEDKRLIEVENDTYVKRMQANELCG